MTDGTGGAGGANSGSGGASGGSGNNGAGGGAGGNASASYEGGGGGGGGASGITAGGAVPYSSFASQESLLHDVQPVMLMVSSEELAPARFDRSGGFQPCQALGFALS